MSWSSATTTDGGTTVTEDAGSTGAEGDVVRVEAPALGLLDARGAVLDPTQVGPLADGQQHTIAVDDELGALDRLRTAAARGVALAELHPCAHQSDHLAVVEQHPLGRHQLDELVAFGEQVLDLLP